MGTVIYCLKQGLLNLKKNVLFSAASAVTIAACIFLFSLCYCIIVNVQHITYKAETTIGITVFFDEGATMEQKEELKNAILEHGGVKEITYMSAEEAWESFKEDYFGDRSEELAAAFADDNPLADSDSYEIFLNNIEDQEAEVEFIRGFDIVREVNYANSIVSALESLNRVIYVVSGVIITLLFCISIFLISNTINLTAHMRRHENEIMKMIGATNGMIRAPFVVEGTLLGLIGAAVPFALMCYIYKKAELKIAAYAMGNSTLGALKDIAELVPFSLVYPKLITAGLVLGVGMGFLVSFFTIRKHLKV